MSPSLSLRRLLCAGLLLAGAGRALLAADAKPALLPPVPTVITSVSLEMSSTDTETTSVFDKNVVVTGTDMRMTCDHLVVVSTRLGDKTATVGKFDKFKTLTATGHVHIIQGDRDVTCGRADVYPRENRVVLTEQPVVIDSSGPYVAKGTRIILLRGERRLFGDNVEITGPPMKDLGFTKDAPMQSPAPEPAK